MRTFSSPLPPRFALHGYFSALAVELAPARVAVTLACPGPVATEIARRVHGSGASDVDASKMPAARCAFLIAVAIRWRVAEAWISKQPELLFAAIVQYAPNLGTWLARTVGGRRVEAFREGRDLFAASAYLGTKRA